MPESDESRPRRAKFLAVARATGTIMVLGAVCGALIGAVLVNVITAISPGGLRPRDIPTFAVMGGVFGAAIGAIFAPLIGWTLLRTVPLGRAIVVTGIGTVVGMGVGHWAPAREIPGALAGFVVAAVGLRLYQHERG